jgi:hypothetical protein
MSSQYAWSTDYSYNVFGADEHYEVTLYRLNGKGTKWKPIQTWSYSTFMMERLAHNRAEKRISKLKRVYGAKAI